MTTPCKHELIRTSKIEKGDQSLLKLVPKEEKRDLDPFVSLFILYLTFSFAGYA